MYYIREWPQSSHQEALFFKMKTYQTPFVLFLCCIFLTACGLPISSQPAQTATPIPQTALATAALSTPTPQPTPTVPSTATALPSSTPTLAPTATDAPTASPIPTYVKLRGEVMVEQAVCHYGPGAPYLYKYGVYQGNNLEIIGRIELGTYIKVQAIGGKNPCWVNPEWMKITGDIKDVQPIAPDDVGLPQSPYYGPLTGVSAQRQDNEVTVSWNPLELRAGDDSLQVPYLIEAWVCQNGQFAFTPFGSYKTTLKIQDEPGCAEPSHARVYAAEKHGYTRLVEIPWPAPNLPTASP
jgi:hypothetical protein